MPLTAMFFAMCLAFLAVFWLTPWGVPALQKLSGGKSTPDLSPGYRPDDAYRLLQSLGEKGIAHWRRLLWLDMVFPALYATFLALLAVQWAQFSGAGPGWRLATVSFPVLSAAADYIENVLWLRVLGALPKRLPGTVIAAGYFTRAKFAFFGATLLIPLVHLAVQHLA
jgi:hypothetical protein